LGREPLAPDQPIGSREYEAQLPAVARRRFVEDAQRAQHAGMVGMPERDDRAFHFVPARSWHGSKWPSLRISSRTPARVAVAAGIRSMAHRRAVVFRTSQRARRRRAPRESGRAAAYARSTRAPSARV